MYVPESYKITSVKQAANFTDAFNVSLNYTQDGTKSVEYTAIDGVRITSTTYKNYIISPNDGITTVQITLAKV